MLQRQPKPRALSGLKEQGPIGPNVRAAVDYYGDPKNADRSLAEYAAFLHKKSN